MEIFVGNLPPKVREWEIRAIFEKYGEVASVKLVFDHITKESKGIAFVSMPDDFIASFAIEELNGAVLEDTHKITVNRSNKANELEKNRKGFSKGTDKPSRPGLKKASGQSPESPRPLPRPDFKKPEGSGKAKRPPKYGPDKSSGKEK